MTKKEMIWRHILHQVTTRRQAQFTQKELAARFGFSLSTVFNALQVPRKLGAVEVTGRYFRVRDPEKFLLLWATHRNLKKDILYETHVDEPVNVIESSQPAGIIFGAFSAYKLTYKDAPADYGKVFVYGDQDLVKKRFPPKEGYSNLFVLKSDEFLSSFGNTTPPIQIFVDIWNIEDWYAKDFINALKEKLNL